MYAVSGIVTILCTGKEKTSFLLTGAMLINTQCEVFKHPEFTTPHSLNSITLNKIYTIITRSHMYFGAVENGINVKKRVHRRSHDFKFSIENSLVACVKVNLYPQTHHLPCQTPMVRSG
jgi:hypothetical protein